jgi:membrane protein DedA with SNARE-associated domain
MDHAVQFLVCHGYAVLFAWIFAEQVGLPIPTIPLLLAAGSLATSGRMNFAWSLGLALAACLMADGLWYQIGRWRGPKILRLLCRILLQPDSCAHRIKAASRRYGEAALLVAKFVPGLNFAAPPLAGVSGVNPLRFLIFDSVASVLWAGGYMTLGYVFSGQFERLAVCSWEPSTVRVAVLIAVIAAWISFKLMRGDGWLASRRGGEDREQNTAKANRKRLVQIGA